VLGQVAGGVAAELAKLGAGELIAACTHCLHTIQNLLPEIKTRSIYEVLEETGLPNGIDGNPPARFNIQDACGARQAPGIHAAVRHLVQAAGHDFEEMAHTRERSLCCGSGGMVAAVAPDLAQRMTEARLAEARFDLLTYCAACRARFAAAGRPSLHLLELLFNPGWRRDKQSAPASSLTRWLRRWRLKRFFEKL
jgi:glutamate synthase (NADPH/NADH) small chain